MKHIFHSQLEAYFPTSLIYFGYLLCPAGIFVAFTTNYFLGAVLILVGIFLVTAHYGILIDIDQKRYKEYWGAIGFKNGSWKVLAEIDYIYVNKKNYTEVRGSRGTSSKFHFTIYRAFLKSNGEEGIEVAQSKDQEKVLGKAKKLGTQLELEVMDRTAG
ncbi:MAG: hypothetical protein ACR2MX_16735 [Cyclobacteriaceae bacterium]